LNCKRKGAVSWLVYSLTGGLFSGQTAHRGRHVLQCESKKSPHATYGFLTFFHKRLRILNRFLHTYYTFLSALDNKFLFSYLKF